MRSFMLANFGSSPIRLYIVPQKKNKFLQVAIKISGLQKFPLAHGLNTEIMDIELILTNEGRFITTAKTGDQTSEYICLEMSLLDFLNSDENFILGEESQIKFTRKADKSFVAAFPAGTSDILKTKIEKLLAENKIGEDCQ